MFRLCVAQPPADLASPRDRLDWLRETLPRITEARADLVLLPELFACGYNIGAALAQRAETQDGPTFAAMAGLARAHGVAIHYGYAERDGAAIYSSAACVSPEGAVLGRHRKLVIPPGFERDHFTPGAGVRLFDYRGLRMATLICYDAEFPESVRHVAAKGAQLVLVPTALGAQWGWVAESMIPTRAYENGIYLAYANCAGSEHGFDYLGASVIAAPDGTEVARAGSNPGLILADLDPARIGAAQARLPYLGDRKTFRF